MSKKILHFNYETGYKIMPWGGNDNGNEQGPWGNSPPPQQEQPDFEDLLKKGRERFDGFVGGGNGQKPEKKSIVMFAFIVIILWLGSGVYQVEPEERGAVLRFGAFDRTAEPGLNYHIPQPFEKVIKVPFTTINRVEVGIHTSEPSRRNRGATSRKILAESLMLTGDENIVDIVFEVQWKINNIEEYLFRVKTPANTVKSMAESAMREVIGRTKIADVLTEGRSEVELETKEIIQKTLDYYEAGIEVVRVQIGDSNPPSLVVNAFRDVQTARADMERLRNEAEIYSNDIIPRARGEAEKILQDAEAYKQEVIALAEGEASRFSSIYEKYREAKNITKQRMYIETMESVMKGIDKVILDSGPNGSGVIPYLPLPEIKKKSMAGQ